MVRLIRRPVNSVIREVGSIVIKKFFIMPLHVVLVKLQKSTFSFSFFRDVFV